MADFLIGLSHAAKHLFVGQKPLLKWVETATPDEVLKSLSKAYVKGNDWVNFAPLLTTAELATLEKNLSSSSQADAGLSECLGFYAGYPFKPLSSPLDKNSSMRAILGLTGRDGKALNRRNTLRREDQEVIQQRGRGQEDKLRLLFCTLSGATPTQEDILDALYIIQPRPDECSLPYGHEKLRPIIERWNLSPVAVTEVSIPKEKLVAFMKTIGFDAPVMEGDVSFKAFIKLCEAKPGVLDALEKKTTSLLSV